MPGQASEGRVAAEELSWETRLLARRAVGGSGSGADVSVVRLFRSLQLPCVRNNPLSGWKHPRRLAGAAE
jgi:hypothetical protein